MSIFFLKKFGGGGGIAPHVKPCFHPWLKARIILQTINVMNTIISKFETENRFIKLIIVFKTVFFVFLLAFTNKKLKTRLYVVFSFSLPNKFSILGSIILFLTGIKKQFSKHTLGVHVCNSLPFVWILWLL